MTVQGLRMYVCSHHETFEGVHVLIAEIWGGIGPDEETVLQSAA